MSLVKLVGVGGIMGEAARLSSLKDSSWERETDVGHGLRMGEAGYPKD
jgi:hypothetical protein